MCRRALSRTLRRRSVSKPIARGVSDRDLLRGSVSPLEGDDVGFSESFTDVAVGCIRLAMVERLELIPTGEFDHDQPFGLPFALEHLGPPTPGAVDTTIFSGDLRHGFKVATVAVGLHIGRTDISNQKSAHSLWSSNIFKALDDTDQGIEHVVWPLHHQ